MFLANKTIKNKVGNINNHIDFKSGKVLKTFALDRKGNFDRELSFYKMCKNNSIDQVPNLIDYSYEKQEIVITYLPGEHPQYISKKVLLQVSEFLSVLNKDSDSKKLPDAAEAILTKDCLTNHLTNRLKQIGNEGEYHPQGLANAVDDIINVLENKLIDIGRIVINPSDLGLHNMIYQNGKITFYDFEYSGKDSYLKLLIDFCLHPMNKINFTDFEIYNAIFSEALNTKPLVISNTIIQAFCLWWVMRLINSVKAAVMKDRINKGLIHKHNMNKYLEERFQQIEIFWNHAQSF